MTVMRAHYRGTYGRLPEQMRARIQYPVRRLRLVAARDVAPVLDFAPPGHVYSPIPTLRDIDS